MIKIKVFQFYFYPDISAVSQLLGELLEKISDNKDIEITVYCGKTAYTGDKEKNNLPGTLGNVKIKRIPTPTIGKKNILLRILEYLSYYAVVFFISLFSSSKCTIISMTSPPMLAFFAAAALKFKKNRFVYYIEDLFPETLYDMGYIKDPIKIRKLEILNKIIFKRADSVITLGRKMTEKISEKYNIDSAKIFEIANWYTEIKSIEEINKKPEGFKLFYSGNMGIAHDFTLLENLVEELKNDSDIFYEFAGGGNRKEEIRELFLRCGEARISINGYRPRQEHFRALQDADILIASQRGETVGDILPSKIYSYLAAGKPIIFLGPLDSEISDLVIGNDIGTVIELPEDIKKAADYIRTIKYNPHIADSVEKRAKYLYKKNYTLDKSSEKFLEVINI